MHACMLSHSVIANSFVTPWTVAHQAPMSMGFSRQEYWSWLLFPPPGDHPDPGTEPPSLVSPALAGSFFTTAPPGKPFHTGKQANILGVRGHLWSTWNHLLLQLLTCPTRVPASGLAF